MYTELHLHTAYSFLDGASKPDEVLNRAHELGYTALAITDHDGVYGAMEFAQLAPAHDITPITGAEVTLADGSHITLLVENVTGYGNLCRLLTHLHHGHPPAAVDLCHNREEDSGRPTLGEYANGLILLTGCRNGQLARLVDAGNIREAEMVVRQYIDWFGKTNVLIEVQQNYVFGDSQRIDRLVQLADRLDVRYVATGNVHYHRRNRHRLQDVMVSIHHRTTLDGSHRQRRANSEFYLRSPAEAERIFSQYPEAIRSTELIAERCASFILPRDLKYTFPDYDTGTGETPDEHLARTCFKALATRYETITQNAIDRLKEELRLIEQHKLAGFFLIYRDLLELAAEVAAELRGQRPEASRRSLPPGRGRGSSVSSIVCYLIGLSPVDPLAHDLYVGRFLNEQMSSIPDIDLDFPREIRERLIERVYEIYGADRAALVCTFATYRLRGAVRDIGKTLGLPLTDLDRIAKLSEPRSANQLAGELQRLPEFAARMHLPPWSDLIDLARQLAGFPRHISQHPGGMIISASPLNAIVPIQPAAMAGRFICQWDKDSCEDAEFIKIDFLSLGMLSLVEECLDLIDDAGQPPVDLSRIDFNDPVIYEMIQAGDTVGVFQIESRAQIQMLRRTLPMCLHDLVVQVAIVRPGPIIGGAVTPYVRRREDPNYQVDYDHESLQPILKETLGVMLYQEQVVQVAEKLAGFSAGDADELRRAMTRKRSHEAMEAMRETFIQGAMATHSDVTRELADAVFDKLAGFAEYGFPKSHAAAFGLLAYQSCWLKHYYPAEFLCALLNNQPMGFYAPHVLINDAERHGIGVYRPDVNRSGVNCTVETKNAVRIGLSFIKGLGEDVARAIVDERQRGGPYTSLADLIRRIALRPDAARNLIAAQACDFGLQQREMLWQLGLFIPAKRFGSHRTRKTIGTQLSLDLPTEQDHVTLNRTTDWERMTDEYRVLGMSPHFHPLGLLRPSLPDDTVSSRDLESMKEGAHVRLPGLIVCRQRPATGKGITFLLLEDEFGLVNIVVYPALYERQRLHVRATPLLIVEGRLQTTGNNINVVAAHLVAIEELEFASPYRPVDTKEDPWVLEESVNLQIIQLDRRTTPDSPRTTADILAISPEAHNYR